MIRPKARFRMKQEIDDCGAGSKPCLLEVLLTSVGDRYQRRTRPLLAFREVCARDHRGHDAIEALRVEVQARTQLLHRIPPYSRVIHDPDETPRLPGDLPRSALCTGG